MNRDILQSVGFYDQLDRINEGLCPICGVEIDPREFHDPLSKREFEISGLCQKCQYKVFDNIY